MEVFLIDDATIIYSALMFKTKYKLECILSLGHTFSILWITESYYQGLTVKIVTFVD